MAETSHPKNYGGLRVLIVGGGVAGLEALLAAEPVFWYRPLAVAEPFDGARVRPVELGEVAESAGASFTLGELASVDARKGIARTSHGAEVAYDALVIAC